MHDSAYRIGELVMRTYSDLPNAKILEIGSLNVNGCLRDAAAPTTRYTGLDLEDGPSVDHVITPGTDFPVESDSFDLVMASSVFEHDTRFWDTFVRMCRAARPGGHIYVNAPSNGTVHRYPKDCWRFYPDAGLALAEHARSEGLEVDLVESFIGNRHSDVWNDFVAVFRKGPSAEPMNTAFVYHRYPSLNARTWQSSAIYNESVNTEDMNLIEELRHRCEMLSDPELEAERTRELDEARHALAAERDRHTALTTEMARLSAALSETTQNNGRIAADKEHLAGEIATLESNLRQRQEEIEQAWSQADKLTAEREGLLGRIEDLQTVQERLQTRLLDADGWVFDLAGERRSLEKRLSIVQSELEQARRLIARMEAVSEFRQQQLDEHGNFNRRVLAGVARLQGLEIEPGVLKVQTGRLRDEWQEEQHPLSNLAVLLDQVADSIPEQVVTGTGNIDRPEREAVSGLMDQKTSLHRDIEILMNHLEQREIAARHAEEQVATLTQALASVRADALEYHGKASQALEQLGILQAESKQQARKLQAAEDRAGRKDRQLEWLRRLYRMIESSNAGLKGVLPPSMRRRYIAQMLRSRNHFDGEAYLAKYSDVAEAGIDPLHHYILHGMAEGRFVDTQSQG